MKKHSFFRRLAVMTCAALPMAVMAQSTNNDDGVVKLDIRFRHNDARSGEVLVKFKDQNPVTIKKAKGRFQSASVRAVDRVLRQFGTVDMEQLFPADATSAKRTMRRSRAFNGKEVVEQDLRVRFIASALPRSAKIAPSSWCSNSRLWARWNMQNLTIWCMRSNALKPWQTRVIK